MFDDNWLSFILFHLLGGLIGLVSASLATHFGIRLAERLPGESRKPHCLFCLRSLSWFELLPLVGWMLRKNAFSFPCPCGKRKNLWHLPAAEILGFIFGLLAVVITGWTNGIVFLCLALGLLPAIAVIDLLFGIIPDELTIKLAIFGLIWRYLTGSDVFMALITASGFVGLSLLFAIIYSKIRGREMLGLGDVKFFGAAGLLLSLEMIPWFLGLSGFLGVILGLLWKRSGGGEEFPFAPALCLSLALCLYAQLIAPFFY